MESKPQDQNQNTSILFEVEIPGRPFIKKNTKRIYKGWNERKPRIIYTSDWRTWEDEALRCYQKAARKYITNGMMFTCPLKARFEFYFENHQAEPDTSNLIEGPQDVLQKACIIKNDKQIVQIEAEKYFGFEPKTIVRLWDISSSSVCKSKP